MDIHRFIKPALTLVAASIVICVGFALFSYLTYNLEPNVRIVGLDKGASYKGVISCNITGDNGYKVKTVSMMLDDKVFEVDGARYVKSKRFSLPFQLNTQELSEGKHVLSFTAVDSSYKSNTRQNTIEFYVDNKPLKAAFLKADYAVLQGRTLHAKVQLNKRVASADLTVFSKVYPCYPASDDSCVYESFIPVECEQTPNEYLIYLQVKDKVDNVVKLSSSVRVGKAVFPKQKGFHVSQEKLHDEKEVSMTDKILRVALKKWLSHSPDKKLWRGAFEVPTVVKRLSTPFGEIRITPEKGRYLHKAVDIVNTPKSVVWASNDGKVIIKDRYLMTGNTVVIDHGLGVCTKYFHLDDFADIEVGDIIRKGSPVGKVGMTGYANGYHLHWELAVNGVSVEPFEWTKKVY